MFNLIRFREQAEYFDAGRGKSNRADMKALFTARVSQRDWRPARKAPPKLTSKLRRR